jgi:Luciferase-like monooxygenase
VVAGARAEASTAFCKCRMLLLIGGAWYDVEHEGLGIDYPSDRVRLDVLEEAVQICRAMFTADDVSFPGTHYRLNHARNLPRPVQAGGPKILIGGGGEKRTLRLVARYADKCNVTGDVSTLTRKISVLRRHCAEVSVTWMTPLILTTSSQNTAEVHEMLAAAGSAEETAGFTGGQVFYTWLRRYQSEHTSHLDDETSHFDDVGPRRQPE